MYIERLIPKDAIEVEIRNLGDDNREIKFKVQDNLEELFS